MRAHLLLSLLTFNVRNLVAQTHQMYSFLVHLIHKKVWKQAWARLRLVGLGQLRTMLQTRFECFHIRFGIGNRIRIHFKLGSNSYLALAQA